MRVAIPFSILLVMTLGLVGCSSAPVHYYTLMAPVAPEEKSSATTASKVNLIEVLPIGMPEVLDRQSLVVRQGETGVVVLERERWAGTLEMELRRALSAQLSTRLGAQDVAGMARSPMQPVFRIKVELRRLDAWPGRQVDLEADWSLGFSNAPEQRLACHTRLQQSVTTSSNEALVLAHQQVLDLLAQKIAKVLKGYRGEAGGVCP